MHKSVRAIMDVVPPPERPVETTGDWGKTETRFGLKFPADYKDFIGVYGSAYFNEFMYVLNPFSGKAASNLFKVFSARLQVQWDLEDNNPDTEYPFRFYPAKGGVLQWGINEGGDEFYWRTHGGSNRWDVVIYDIGISKWKLIESRTFADVLLAMLTDTLEEFWLQNDTPEGQPRCFAAKR